MPEPQQVTRAQLVALRVLADGEWHQSRRVVVPGSVLGTVGAALHRQGLAVRRGESRGPRPQASGFEYQITDAGRAGLATTEGTA